jgi:hypothetical protein
MRLVFTFAGGSAAIASFALLVVVVIGFKRDTNFDGERNVLLAAAVLALIAIALAVLSLGGSR